MSSSDLVIVGICLVVAVYIAYDVGKSKARTYYIPRRGYKSPDLRQLIVKAKFSVDETVDEVSKKLSASLNPYSVPSQWIITTKGNVIELSYPVLPPREPFFPRKRKKNVDEDEEYFAALRRRRSGVTHDVLMVGSEKNGHLELDCEACPLFQSGAAATSRVH